MPYWLVDATVAASLPAALLLTPFSRPELTSDLPGLPHHGGPDKLDVPEPDRGHAVGPTGHDSPDAHGQHVEYTEFNNSPVNPTEATSLTIVKQSLNLTNPDPSLMCLKLGRP